MSECRTIFHHNGVPILEENPSATEWITVQIAERELKKHSDEELMGFWIQCIQVNEYKITETPKHSETPFWVSFPVLDSSVGREQSVAEVITLLEFYKEDIIDNKMSIDREYFAKKK